MTSNQFLIWWNNSFPYDRIWRKKYGIAFNSSTHREINQIDVYLDALEDKLYQEHIETQNNKLNALEHYRNTGEFLIQTDVDEVKASDIFDKLNLDQFNEKDG